MIAAILIQASKLLSVKSPRGNPKFTRKIDPATAALLKERGMTSEDVAGIFGVDPRSERRARNKRGRNSKK